MERNDESLSTRDLASSREAQAAAGTDSQTETRRGDSPVEQAPMPPTEDSDPTPPSSSEAGAHSRGSVGEERSEQPMARTDAGAETRSQTVEDDHTGPLLPTDSSADSQRRWEEIQTRFVDEPRRAVEDADGLVATVMQQLAEGFALERERLEAQWGRGEDISTEELRVTLRRYRSFFHRLLST
jgi:hypothetical protein